MDERIREYYGRGVERDRFDRGHFRLEFARTKELLGRFLPPPPARVLDVGGGPGAYARWLADCGYTVHLVDATPLHVEQATELARGAFTASLGDARSLDAADGTFDAVLVLGPLYHLLERADRVRALAEARRVARSGGVVAAAAISRFSSLLDGLAHRTFGDPRFQAMTSRDIADGRHESPPDGWFTDAYFHHPEELPAELLDAGLEPQGVFGIEGPGWIIRELWDEPGGAEALLWTARAVETEPSLLGASAHLLAVGRA